MFSLSTNKVSTPETKKKVLKAYEDRVFLTSLKDLFYLVFKMIFCSKRTYHPDGSITLILDSEIANELESVFQDQL